MSPNDSRPDSDNNLADAPTLTAALRSLVEQRPDAEALVLADRRGNQRRVTLAELWRRSRAYQALLIERGLQPGQFVVLILPTGTELIEAYFGAVLAGGVPALLSTPLRRVADPKIFTARVAHVVANSTPHSIICEPAVAEIVRGPSPSILGDTEVLLPEQLDLECEAPEPYDPRPNEIATMQYSSGTTGKPKGVLVTHGAVMENLRSMHEAFELSPDDVGVNWIPLFHDMGLFGGFLLPLLTGCRTVLIPTDDFVRDPACWLRAIHEHGGTFSWAPNLAFALCARRVADEDLEGLDLSTWRMALNGSEPVLASTIEAFRDRMRPFGFAPETMSPAWGLAETTVLGAVMPPGELPRCEMLDRVALSSDDRAVPTDGDGVPCVSVGPPVPGTEIEIRDARGTALADRQIGAVWLRSPAVFVGYHRDEERTKEALVDGWLCTGDRGYLVDGYLYFVVRQKDLIIIGGEKYVPDDLEGLINRVPGVRTGCAVAFALLNEELGTDEIAAVVETRETEPEALDALRKAIRTEVAGTLGVGIRYLLLTPPDGVEKTTGGKLSRSGTRDRHLEALLASD